MTRRLTSGARGAAAWAADGFPEACETAVWGVPVAGDMIR